MCCMPTLPVGAVLFQVDTSTYTIVDEEDLPVLHARKWHVTRKGYVATIETTAAEGQRTVFFHRLVNRTPDGLRTDHINRNKLDNRKANLRDASPSQNAVNSQLRSDNTSGHRGVRFRRGRWIAVITCKGKNHELGAFATKEDAVAAYARAAAALFGEFNTVEASSAELPTFRHLRIHNTTGFRGVSPATNRDGTVVYVANLNANKVHYGLGRYAVPAEAAAAYNVAARILLGAAARLNAVALDMEDQLRDAVTARVAATKKAGET